MDAGGPAKRLHIVVPYRDRAKHLAIFAHTVSLYFARDKADQHIPYRVTVVEQDAGLPFNRGMLANIGFTLGRGDSDYTCIHDVDYTPVWADYGWSDTPATLIWHGAETRPISLQNPEWRVTHTPDDFYGGAMLAPNALFAQVNGFANGYWGWGYEDRDLFRRFQKAGIAHTRRQGTYCALDHDNAGFAPGGAPTPTATINRLRYEARWAAGGQVQDGLGSLDFSVLARRKLNIESHKERPAPWEIVTVRISAETGHQTEPGLAVQHA